MDAREKKLRSMMRPYESPQHSVVAFHLHDEAVTYVNSGPSFFFHNGGTAGSSCALYLCPERNAALAILSNNGVAGNL